MTISYSLREQDFLTFQLFVASKSPQVRRARMRVRILGLILYAMIGLIAFLQMNYVMAITFAVMGVLWLLFYPLYQRRRYFRHYRGFIRENYQNRFDKSSTLEINDEFLLGADGVSETKMLCSELELIHEIQSLILIKLKNGQSLLIPKDQISEIDILRKTLQELAASLGIQYIIDEKWEWK